MGTSDGQIDDERSHCRLPLHLPCLRPPASLGPRQLAETSQSLHVVNVAHNNNRDFGGLYAVVTWESGERHFTRVDSALRLRRSPGGGDLVAFHRVAQLVGGSAAALESGRVVKTPGAPAELKDATGTSIASTDQCYLLHPSRSVPPTGSL